MKWNKAFLDSLIIFLILLSLNCNKKIHNIQMFGIPVSNTGLTNNQCNTSCKDSNIVSKSFSQNDLALMKTYTNTGIINEILESPYKKDLVAKPKGVCAVIIEDINTQKYRLETFNSNQDAINAGAVVTHIDACGACSTLQDLTVYAENLDLGASVRKCGTQNLAKSFDKLLECIETIGFTKPCAQIWAYNVKNTQAKCFSVCITNNTYNKNDGTLSKCLQCDEDKSGPVFKAVAGRTRRNTGIANAICRFCDEVEVVEHNYALE